MIRLRLLKAYFLDIGLCLCFASYRPLLYDHNILFHLSVIFDCGRGGEEGDRNSIWKNVLVMAKQNERTTISRNGERHEIYGFKTVFSDLDSQKRAITL